MYQFVSLIGFKLRMEPLPTFRVTTNYQPRRHCAMHTCQLGIFLVLIAEGLIMLAQNRVGHWACTMDQAIYHLYNDFRAWCSKNKIKCSHRRWKKSHLHMETMVAPGLTVPSFPWLNAKAMNSRILLAWLADSYLNGIKTSTQIV